MFPSKYQVSGAIFDIKPVDESGRIDFVKIDKVVAVIDLSSFRNTAKDGGVIRKAKSVRKHKSYTSPPDLNEVPDVSYLDSSVPMVELANMSSNSEHPLVQLESVLNSGLDIEEELTRAGGELNDWSFGARPRYKPVTVRKSGNDISYDEIIKSLNSAGKIYKDSHDDPINQKEDEVSIVHASSYPIDPIAINILSDSNDDETGLGKFWTDNKAEPEIKNFKGGRPKFNLRKNYIWLALGFGTILSLGYFSGYGINIKNQLINESNSAVASLEDAKENLKSLDFLSASTNFAQAYEGFSKAGDGLNFLGANIGSLIADFPGAGKVKSANNLVQAGKLIAGAGKSISDAMVALSRTGAILNIQNKSGDSIGTIVDSFKKALTLSQKNITKAQALLVEVDENDLPQDKISSFQDFKSKLPVFKDLVDRAAGYSVFLEDLIGTRGTKKYLLLFQNQAELRPTGGFPGTYGVVTFKDGRLEDFKVDDVYNLDGQLKDLYVPPKQLQHITPNWALRDANWFIDFPTSAQKIESFFKREAGYDVDGVITVSPQIIASIIDIVGPIDLPDYKIEIDGENFATAIQDEVEYGLNRAQPKSVVMDLAPKLLEKIYSASQDDWYEIFNVLVAGMDGKDTLMYFNDSSLESFVSEQGFNGAVKDLSGSDYLTINLSNIKGSKTDSVMDTSVQIDTLISQDSLSHKITIKRKHNGGSTKYGFYNKQNPEYVRILVPKGSKLINVSGNSDPDFEPLVDYPNSGFKRDSDLEDLEATVREVGEGVTTYEESNKTGFAFWMITDPGKTKTVELEYQVPENLINKNYELYIQKQPGSKVGNFVFNLDSSDMEIVESSPKLSSVGDLYNLNMSLDKDLPIKVKFK